MLRMHHSMPCRQSPVKLTFVYLWNWPSTSPQGQHCESDEMRVSSAAEKLGSVWVELRFLHFSSFPRSFHPATKLKRGFTSFHRAQRAELGTKTSPWSYFQDKCHAFRDLQENEKCSLLWILCGLVWVAWGQNSAQLWFPNPWNINRLNWLWMGFQENPSGEKAKRRV